MSTSVLFPETLAIARQLIQDVCALLKASSCVLLFLEGEEYYIFNPLIEDVTLLLSDRTDISLDVVKSIAHRHASAHQSDDAQSDDAQSDDAQSDDAQSDGAQSDGAQSDDAQWNKSPIVQHESQLYLPIIHHSTLIAVLCCDRDATNLPSGLDCAERVCRHAAAAWAMAQQNHQARSQVLHLERSLQVFEDAQTSWVRNEQILQAQVQALIQLSQSEALQQGDLQSALQDLTEVAARILQVDRASVWLFNRDRTAIECLDLFSQETNSHTQGFELSVTEYPNYFCAIEAEPLLVAYDAQTDTRTCEFKTSYLLPLNIRSMLDSGFQLEGKVGGVVCCEQVGEMRKWSQADRNFVRSIAHLVALIVESDRRQQQTLELQHVLFELQETQLHLVQSEKMSALGSLVAGVAHEINNPVGFLGGNITHAMNYIHDLLALLKLYQTHYPAPPKDIAEFIEFIELPFLQTDLPKLIASMTEGVNRIRDISTSLRTFSRADSVHKQEFNVHDGLDSTLLILTHRLKATSQRPAIEVVKTYGDLPAVHCFPGQLNQVFMNVLANAIDALEEASEGRSYDAIAAQPYCITLTTSTVGGWMKIQIADNGTGISEAIVPHIFEHLFTTKEVGKGTGLGLAIAHQIVVEKHQGKMSVHSVPNQGTEFTIELPL